MSGAVLDLVVRYRKGQTYGVHALLAALETEPPSEPYQVHLARTAGEVAERVRDGVAAGRRVLTVWSFYSPDASVMESELAEVRAATPEGEGVVHLAGGVHATAEPLVTLRAGWDVVAIGEGERAERLPLDHFPAFPHTRNLTSPIEITRGCIYSCRFCQTPFLFSARFRHRSVGSVREQVRVMRGRGHGAEVVEDAVRLAVQEGFRPNVDVIFGMPGEGEAEAGARIHAHTFLPLPGTPWRNEPPGRLPDTTRRALAELTTRGRVYGSWERQEQLAAELAGTRSAQAGHRTGRPRRSP